MAQQSVTLNPGESKTVSFEATPTVAKTYSVSVDGLTGSFKAIEAPRVKVASITLNPTTLTNAKHEYETSLGLGYWGDPFTIAITFDNPFDYDVWVKPDYAFGHLNGEPLGFVNGALQGFSAEKLLYFRLLLQSAYIEGDYSYDTSWQKPWDPRGQNVSSGLAFVYDPDGVPRMGDERWLKVPAGGSVTTTKEAHLGAKLSTEGVAGFHDLCVAALRAIYFVYDPGCGQTRVGGKIVTLNWRLEELDPVVTVVPELVNITPA